MLAQGTQHHGTGSKAHVDTHLAAAGLQVYHCCGTPFSFYAGIFGQCLSLSFCVMLAPGSCTDAVTVSQTSVSPQACCCKLAVYCSDVFSWLNSTWSGPTAHSSPEPKCRLLSEYRSASTGSHYHQKASALYACLHILCWLQWQSTCFQMSHLRPLGIIGG